MLNSAPQTSIGKDQPKRVGSDCRRPGRQGGGDEGDCAYVVTEGSAAVTIRVPEAKRVKRLTTLSYGTMFGEIALLDRDLRSATVTAMEAMVCYRISSDNFEKMKRRSPHLAQVLPITLGRFLTSHLRRATRTLSELER